MSEPSDEPLLDRKTTAKYLGVSPDTLAVWDCTKRYDLRPIKVGRAVRYRKSDIDAFLLHRLRKLFSTTLLSFYPYGDLS